MRLFRVTCVLIALAAVASAAGGALPGRYFQLLNEGIPRIEEHLGQGASDLASLEKGMGWRHFPHALLVAAVLYEKQHPANPGYHNPTILALAKRLGDLVASSNEKGEFSKRLDHHRDLYTWLDAYRLLEKDLDEPRRTAWRRELEKNLAELAVEVEARADFGAYVSPFIGTSPNHFSLWSSTLYLGGKMFNKPEWVKLGGRVMHRFVTQEQAPDGYWGEHDMTGPTTGYDYLTLTAVALYAEHSKDPDAFDALRRSTIFHKNFTYPDGRPVEVVNDRNRYWEVSAWGHFGFSRFPDGRRYAEFLTAHFEADRLGIEGLGRVAQNALYYQEGPTAPIPQDRTSEAYRMKEAPAGIRKAGPWFVCLSGIIATRAATNQFYLDRQGNVSVFHDKIGLIITGANSKHQPELATFYEKIQDEVYYMPQVSRLRMGADEDRLSLALNSFFADLYMPVPRGPEVGLKFRVTPKGRREEGRLNLQLCLKAGETLETGAGRKLTLSAEPVDLGPEELGGWIRHNGWTLKVDPLAGLKWPVFPHNPYGNAREMNLRNAAGVLWVPIRAERPSGQPYGSGVQEISFTVQAN